MQRTIHRHGVDFDVEFTEEGDVEAIYIGGVEVSEVINEATECRLRNDVMAHASDWFAEYRAEMAGEMRRAA